MALTKAVKEAIWLGGLLDELGVGQKKIFIYSDSHSAICSITNPVFHVCTKHIDVHYQFVPEIIIEEQILVQKIETTENPVDMLTKVVIEIKFNNCLNLINFVKV